MFFEGGCLCAAVRFKVAGLHDISHCHCSMCRRQHGAAFASYAHFTLFEWLRGEALTKAYAIGDGEGWCFCTQCGSSLAATQGSEVISIALATLDHAPVLPAGVHLHTASKVSWHTLSEEDVQYPEGRDEGRCD